MTLHHPPSKFAFMRALGSAVLFSSLLLCSCASPRPYPRAPDDNRMFGPVSMRIHPTFTQIKSWTGAKKPDGIEAVVELVDQFGDPTRASGRVMFELYNYRDATPDRRGERLASPWISSLGDKKEQAAHWSSAAARVQFPTGRPRHSAQSSLCADCAVRPERGAFVRPARHRAGVDR